jgi:glycosyltransferase involved in cell wall biosynthesis
VGRLDPSIESYIRSDIANMGLEKRILITGNLPLPFDYYLSSDIFLLTSREDPLPSVVMEAFDAGLPVVGFEGAGGFVEILDGEERGALVSYMNEASMSEAIIRIKARLDIGETFNHNHGYARSHFDYVNYLESLLSATLSPIGQTLTVISSPITVSAVIPNYNYKKYLGGRLSSVLCQTQPVNEIIFLDDCSQDGSLDYAISFLSQANIPVKIISNDFNSGSVATQWMKGIDSSSFNYIWIAEADDYCEQILNQQLSTIAAMNAKHDLSIVYCQSHMVDSSGRIGSTYYDYYSGINSIHASIFNDDFLLGGEDFIENFLGVTNVIPNSSACLLSRNKLASLDWQELLGLKYSADWMTYLRMSQLGTIAFTSKTLNYHRRHSDSVINKSLKKPASIYTEALLIQDRAASLINDLSKHNNLKKRANSWLSTAFANLHHQ